MLQAFFAKIAIWAISTKQDVLSINNNNIFVTTSLILIVFISINLAIKLIYK
jgi:hypothetical protein